MLECLSSLQELGEHELVRVRDACLHARIRNACRIVRVRDACRLVRVCADASMWMCLYVHEYVHELLHREQRVAQGRLALAHMHGGYKQ